MNRSEKINKVWFALATVGLLLIGLTKYFFYKNTRELAESKSGRAREIEFKSK